MRHAPNNKLGARPKWVAPSLTLEWLVSRLRP